LSDPLPNLRWWLRGLVAFAIVVALGLGITAPDSVTFGITDHQAAESAARVNEIQAQWRQGGVRNFAIAAMIGDLIFIGIYSWGSWLAGRSFMAMSGPVRMIGSIVAPAALVFAITDYIETILQVIQLLQDAGSDWMAAIVASMGPIKAISWVTTFGGVLLAIAIRRFRTTAA